MTNKTPHEVIEEGVAELDINQRLFLARKLHSTKFNKWFQEYSQKLVEVTREEESEIRFQMMEQIRHDVNMTLYDNKYPQREGLQQASVKDFTLTKDTPAED